MCHQQHHQQQQQHQQLLPHHEATLSPDTWVHWKGRGWGASPKSMAHEITPLFYT